MKTHHEIHPNLIAKSNVELFTGAADLRSELPRRVAARAAPLVNESDEVIQVAAAVVVFAGFVRLREELQRRITGNSEPEEGVQVR